MTLLLIFQPDYGDLRMYEKRHEKALKTLKTHYQEHLLGFWDKLDSKQKQGLLEQIKTLDFEKIDQWVKNLVKNSNLNSHNAYFEKAGYYPAISPNEKLAKKYAKARQLGKKLISNGKVAAFTVAGGQGTRLGFDGPKGDFPLSPIKNKTLFTIFAEAITAASAKYGTNLPWYVMTSPLNFSQTKNIFDRNNYFGLDSDDVFIFQQGTIPNFNIDGRILLSETERIACSPDGHGGSLKALYQSGAIEDMKKRGVEFISYFQVDNSLINIFDPLFIGLHAADGAEMSSKAVKKTGPDEKVGNFCLVDGRVTVIEYSDLPDELAKKKNEDGSLVFELGSIAIHIISRDFVERLNAGEFALPLHRAVKKIPYIDADGNIVEPAEPNGVKLETFVFDALAMAEVSIIFETLRAQEFAPLKNAAGVDSAESARQLLIARAANWLESVGIEVPKKADGKLDAVIEMAASFAVEKEDVKAKAGTVPEIKSGDEVYLQ